MEEIDESSHASKNRTSLQDIGWVFGDYISDQDHIDDVLNGLPKEYNTFFMQVYGHLDPSTMYDVEVIIHFQQAQLDKFKKELSVSNVT
ncbi:hypothetical protein KIW84_012343 [Lathyrus oleraceus]|uniref:Uncharacterized protein n=1 Tax=Pisum sativum TaxID=3888 RepID=A0A9D5GW61_PEA|nr:hypothetical protein KIW84_012343 [Pisum sativum]